MEEAELKLEKLLDSPSSKEICYSTTLIFAHTLNSANQPEKSLLYTKRLLENKTLSQLQILEVLNIHLISLNMLEKYKESLELAFKYLDKNLEENTDATVRIYSHIVFADIQLKEFELADSIIEEVLKIKIEDTNLKVSLLFLKSQIHFKKGNLNLALRNLDEAKLLQPTAEDLLKNIDRFIEKIKKRKRLYLDFYEVFRIAKRKRHSK